MCALGGLWLACCCESASGLLWHVYVCVRWSLVFTTKPCILEGPWVASIPVDPYLLVHFVILV